MNKEQLKEAAENALDRNPKLKTVFVTSDGQAFGSENLANLHANTNATGKKLGVTAFTAVNPANLKVNDATNAGDSNPVQMSVKKLGEFLPTVTEVTELEALLKTETEGDNRKTAVAAIEARINELKPAE